MHILWIFKVLKFHNFEIMNFFFSVSNRLLLAHIFYHQLAFIIWVLCKIFIFNNKKFHFQKSLTKPKPKIGLNGFLIWVSWHSYVLKNDNVHDYHGFKWQEKK
jgi:hypothetical protein